MSELQLVHVCSFRSSSQENMSKPAATKVHANSSSSLTDGTEPHADMLLLAGDAHSVQGADFDVLCCVAGVLSSPTEEREEPSEGLSYRQQESHLCQQMKLATVSQGQESAAGWFQEEPATCSTAQPCPGQEL